MVKKLTRVIRCARRKKGRVKDVAVQPFPNQQQRAAMRPDTESKRSKNARFK